MTEFEKTSVRTGGFWATVFHVSWLLKKLTERNKKRRREKELMAALQNEIHRLKRERSALQRRLSRIDRKASRVTWVINEKA